MGFLVILLAFGLSIFVTARIFREKGSVWSKSACFLIIFPFAWFALTIVTSGGRSFGSAMALFLALMMLAVALPLSFIFWMIDARTTIRGQVSAGLKMPEDLSVNYRCVVCTTPNHPTNKYCTECKSPLISDSKA